MQTCFVAVDSRLMYTPSPIILFMNSRFKVDLSVNSQSVHAGLSISRGNPHFLIGISTLNECKLVPLFYTKISIQNGVILSCPLFA